MDECLLYTLAVCGPRKNKFGIYLSYYFRLLHLLSFFVFSILYECFTATFGFIVSLILFNLFICNNFRVVFIITVNNNKVPSVNNM